MSTTKKVAKGKSKTQIKPKLKSAPATTAEPGYAGHTVGSCKGTIHELFDKEGEHGRVRPSAFAVLRLITSSNLVGCMTGRSAGLFAIENTAGIFAEPTILIRAPGVLAIADEVIE
jgi:hypothetical protein